MNEYEFNKNIKSIICQNIKKYRNAKKVRLMDLAEAIDVTPDHLKRIEAENDRNNISLITLYKISVVLGVRIDKFFEEWEIVNLSFFIVYILFFPILKAFLKLF